MTPIIQFIFFYVVVPYGSVIALGIFPCLEKRESVENSERADCPLTTVWTWLTPAFLFIVGVLWFFKSASSMADLLSSEIIGGTYFLSFVILTLCALVFVVIRLVLGLNKRNNSRLLSSPVQIPFAVIAVLSTLYGSTLVMEFFKDTFLITH